MKGLKLVGKSELFVVWDVSTQPLVQHWNPRSLGLSILLYFSLHSCRSRESPVRGRTSGVLFPSLSFVVTGSITSDSTQTTYVWTHEWVSRTPLPHICVRETSSHPTPVTVGDRPGVLVRW